MGSDDLHHKRKQQRRLASMKRSKAKKAPHDRVLIVCEGTKTEPTYFKKMCNSRRLRPENITILGEECASDPLSVVKYAIKRFRKDPDYDRVYCVIDRDKHATFYDAINKVRDTRLGKKVSFKAIVSDPCFEFWLLLHFKCTTRQFMAQGESSNCEQVITELKCGGRIPNYDKGAQGVYELTKERLDDAIINAKRVLTHNQETDTSNPSTNVHELIEYLISLNPQNI